MENFLRMAAWEMIPPQPYGFLHISILIIGLPAMIYLAWKTRQISAQKHRILMAALALLLLVFEVYKQCFHFYIMDHQQYDWWIFPFQLCSVPIYLCLLLPFLKQPKIIRPVETFLMDFNLLGGIMALLFPEDLMQPYVILTLHAFIWHLILVFIGFHIGFSRFGDVSKQGFFKTLPILAGCLLLATFFNITLHSYGEINMFYMSPYEASTQPVFSLLSKQLGILGGNLCYLMAMILGAYLIHCGFAWYHKQTSI